MKCEECGLEMEDDLYDICDLCSADHARENPLHAPW